MKFPQPHSRFIAASFGNIKRLDDHCVIHATMFENYLPFDIILFNMKYVCFLDSNHTFLSLFPFDNKKSSRYCENLFMCEKWILCSILKTNNMLFTWERLAFHFYFIWCEFPSSLTLAFVSLKHPNNGRRRHRLLSFKGFIHITHIVRC